MKIKNITKTNLFEHVVLDEDKQIKLGGEVNPKYGWCVIYAGGSASGKSTATDFNLPFVGKKLDVDEFKSLDKKITVKQNDSTISKMIRPGFIKSFEGGKYYDMILNHPRINGDESKMSLNDKDYPAVAHEVLDPFTDKLKDRFKNIGQHNSPDRLPNIIFDQTTKNIDKLRKQVFKVKQQGYKVAIVYVLTDMHENLKQFYRRGQEGRKLNRDIFFDIHPKVIDTILGIFEDNELLSALDDFWVIVNKYKGINTDKQKQAQIKDTNVYHVPLEPDGLQQTHFITSTGKNKKETLYDMIIANKKYLDFIK